MKVWSLLKRVSLYAWYSFMGVSLTSALIHSHPIISSIVILILLVLWYYFRMFCWATDCRLHLVEKYQKALERSHLVSSNPDYDDHAISMYAGYTRAISEYYKDALTKYTYDDPSEVLEYAALLYENDVYKHIIAIRKSWELVATYHRALYYAYKDISLVGYREYRKIVSGKLDLLGGI